MKRIILLLMFIVTSFFCFSKGQIDKKVDVKYINGIKHIHNKDIPAKGTVTIKLKKSLTIEPGVGEANIADLFFDDYVLDESGNIYLVDSKEVKIHKFSSSGKFIKTFLKKGEGPGEFGIYPYVQIHGNNIYIYGEREKKIAWYTLNGTFLKEKKLKKFYYSLRIIDEKRFIANVEKYASKDITKFTKCLGIYTFNEKNILNFFEAENAGRIFVKFGERSHAVIPDPGIIPDIIHTFDLSTKRVYITLNRDYKILVKNLEGNSEFVIHKENKNAILKHSDKVDIVNSFGNIPKDFKEAIIDAFPAEMCSILNIDPLSNGYILVRYIISYSKTGFDVFSKKGKYVYSLELPDDIKLETIKFYKGLLCGIENREETPVYHQFKVKSLPEVFMH